MNSESSAESKRRRRRAALTVGVILAIGAGIAYLVGGLFFPEGRLTAGGSTVAGGIDPAAWTFDTAV